MGVSKMPANKQFTVYGQIIQNEKPLAHIQVEAYHRQLREEVLLGTDKTDSQGNYQIYYDIPESASEVNLQVRAGGSEPSLVASSVIFRAEQMERVNLIAPTIQEKNEWEQLEVVLTPLIGTSKPYELKQGEIEYLAGVSPYEFQQISAWANAYQLNLVNDRVPAVFYYGLLRQGFSSDLNSIASHRPEELTTALGEAISNQWIPNSALQKVDNVISTLQNLGQQQKEHAIANLIQGVFRSWDHQRLMDEDTDAQQQEEIQFALQINDWSGHNHSLISALIYLRQDGESLAQTLVKLDEADWKRFVSDQVAQGMIIDETNKDLTEEEQIEAFSKQLYQRIEIMYPNFFIAHRLKQSTSRLLDGDSTDLIVAEFLEQEVDFNLSTTTIDDYVQKHAENRITFKQSAQEAVVNRLKAFQRVAQVAPRYDHFSVLLAEGFDSAYRISSVTEPVFIEQLASSVGSDQAKQIYANAEHLTATMTHLLTSMHQAMNDVTPAIMQNSSSLDTLSGNLPNWASLFGSLEMCECEHCRSVYSPAAYLVDLLQFLNLKVLPPYVKHNPLQILLSRRPDLEHIKLTCENTNTTMPYVDLVNEVVESYIVLGKPLENNTSAQISSDALNVNREYSASFTEEIFNRAYRKLEDAIYPFSVPFHRQLESIRAYLKQLGTTRYELLETFPVTSTAVERAGEYMGLSKKETQIWLAEEGHLPLEYFGYQVFYPGVSADYYKDANAVYAYLYRFDPKPAFFWSGSTLPENISRQFAVRWRGKLVPAVTDMYTFHTTTEGSVRLWIDGELAIDEWTPHRLSEHTSINSFYLEAGKRYDFEMKYADTSTNPICSFKWSYGDVHVVEIEPQYFEFKADLEVMLNNLNYFLKTTGLSYEELLELLSTRFINSNPNEPEIRLFTNGTDCDLDMMDITNLDSNEYEPLMRIHRFIRLWRKLGITMKELDKLLLRFGNTPAMFLINYVEMSKLQSKLGTDISKIELLSLWFHMDTRGDQSHYLSVFQNKTYFNPPDADFQLNQDQTELTGKDKTIDSKISVLLAILRITDTELALIRQDARLEGSAAKLTLLNVSALYRYTLLAKLLKCPIQDLIAYKRLLSLNPFSSPSHTLNFIEKVNTINKSDFSPELLRYLYFDEAKPTMTNRIESLATVLAKQISSGFEQIMKDTNHSIQEKHAKQRLLVIQTISEAYGVMEPLTAWLLETILQSVDSSLAANMLHDFMKPESNNFKLSTKKLDKVIQLIQYFELSFDEVKRMIEYKDVFSNLELNLLPINGTPSANTIAALFEQWMRLQEYKLLKDNLQPTQLTWFDFFADARKPEVTMSGLLDKLSQLTGWKMKELTVITGPQCLNVTAKQLLSVSVLTQITAVMGRLNKIRVPAEQILTWLNYGPDTRASTSIKETVKARYDEQTWLQIAAPIEEALRDKQRDALTTYVVHSVLDLKNSSELYEHFLIDVDMGNCMKTSRIKQAISSVQLFIQRCLLNIEPLVPPIAIDTNKWEWMKNYRSWEANRKVFLYPENWIEPELRDDKSPIFKSVENELLQGEMTTENAENSIRGYLEMLDEVAHLDIRGVFIENSTPSVLHVFARTEAIPHVYYHRYRKNNIWSSWKKMDVEIQGEHILPIVFRNRVFLFWPIFEKVADKVRNKPAQDKQGQTPYENFSLKMAWSEFRHSKWTKKKVTSVLVNLPEFPYGTDEKQEQLKYAFQATEYPNEVRFPVTYGFRVYTTNELLCESNYLGSAIFDINQNFRFESANYFIERNIAKNVRQHGNQLQALNANQSLTYSFRKRSTNQMIPITVLSSSESPFRLIANSIETWNFYSDEYFKQKYFYQDSLRTYLVEPRDELVNGEPSYQFSNHYHMFLGQFFYELNSGGVSALLSPFIQNYEEIDVFKKKYNPTTFVYNQAYPKNIVDFNFNGAYSVYNWELFFHIPLMIAVRLSKEQRFEEARQWFHYIFNPTLNNYGYSDSPWKFKPFKDNTQAHYQIWSLLNILADPVGSPEIKQQLKDQIADWRKNPFEPHRIARLRISAYQKNVVMKYIDHLIAWGDKLFAQDTIESINEATQIYILANHLLGPRPQKIPALTQAPDKTYSQIKDTLDDFSNVMVEVQNRFPFVQVNSSMTSAAGGTQSLAAIHSLYFGIPKNDKLLGYWDTVEDRLNKVRSCMNIDGVARALVLFEPPIDPAFAVKAKAAGLDLGTVLTDSLVTLGHYRFSYLLPKAIELVQEVKSLGNQLVSALEKKDSEALSVLRAKHEPAMLQLIKQVKEIQIEEAKTALEGINKTKAITDYRLHHYRSLEFTNAYEKAQMVLSATAAIYQTIGQGTELAAAIARAFPDIDLGASGWAATPVVKGRYGGSNAGAAIEAFSRAMNFLAAIANSSAAMSATMGGYKRRAEDWSLQENIAIRELQQIEKQLAASELRIRITERELRNHDKQIQNALEVETFLRDKYTNEDLYQWMVSQVSGLFFQVYQLAYQAAKKAEQAYKFERGLTTSNYIQFGHWDSLKKGLLSGERLYLDLKRLEMAYQDQNAREYELTKQISLLHLDPLALIALKTTGKCIISLPEALFDLDHPGHYMRRIKAVTLTIPCVTGPYTGVNGRLTLESSKIRTSKLPNNYAEQREEDFLSDFTQVESIATSTAQNDSGLFELSFRDERYLPFEGAGAISKWHLELPKEANGFDFDTISDVVIKLLYTAREGGDQLRKAATMFAHMPEMPSQGTTDTSIKQPAQNKLHRLFSVKHEFANEWRQFLYPSATATTQQCKITIYPERFPYRYRGDKIKIEQMQLFLRLKDGISYPNGKAELELNFYPAGSTISQVAVLHSDASYMDGTPQVSIPIANSLVTHDNANGSNEWIFEATETNLSLIDSALIKTSVSNIKQLNPEAIEDLIIMCQYKVETN